MTLYDPVAQFCARHHLLEAGDTVVVGVSGGPDSLTLLDILRRMTSALNLKLHVAHLNHGLRGAEADADAAFVAEVARRWKLPLHQKTVSVAQIAQQQKKSVEDAARIARYTFLVAVAERVSAQKIAVGHHADDQSETVLLHFLRGAGLDGLRGMRPASPVPVVADAPATLIRPLLETTRAGIESYCREHHLSPRFDTSNADEAFTRNRVRHQLLPALEAFNPNIRAALRRTAALMQADFSLVEREVDRAWQFVVKTTATDAITIDRTDWQVLSPAAQARVLRRAIARLRHAATDIDFRHIERALIFLNDANAGAQWMLPQNLRLWQQYATFVLADANFYPPLPIAPLLPPGTEMPVAVPGITPLPESEWYLQANLMDVHTIAKTELRQNRPWQAFFDAELLVEPMLRTRRPGDRFAPFGLDGHQQRLKKFMIDRKIPPPQRNRIPLLTSATDDIVWVCGWRTAHPYRVTSVTDLVVQMVFKR